MSTVCECKTTKTTKKRHNNYSLFNAFFFSFFLRSAAELAEEREAFSIVLFLLPFGAAVVVWSLAVVPPSGAVEVWLREGLAWISVIMRAWLE